MPSFDSVVIGAGQAGPPLAARLAAAGQKVAVIARAQFVGACGNTGDNDYEIVADNLLNGASRRWTDRLAVYARTPVEEFQRPVRVHPNVSELLPTVMERRRPLA